MSLLFIYAPKPKGNINLQLHLCHIKELIFFFSFVKYSLFEHSKCACVRVSLSFFNFLFYTFLCISWCPSVYFVTFIFIFFC